MSGYLDFNVTGFEPFDAVLRKIEQAGDAYHNTSDWGYEVDGGEPAHIDQINEAINEAAIQIRTLQAKLEAAEKDAARWCKASTSRNFGITNWCEFGQRTSYDKAAEELIDAAIASDKE